MSTYKTRIPFQNTQTLAGTGLPGAAEVVTLFNSVTAMGPRNLQNTADFYWFTYSIAPSTNATGNSVTAQYSNDGGATWLEFYASTANEPVGDSTTFTDEIFIGPYADIRVRFNNGALAQASLFAVNMTLDASDRPTAGV
jgi:uncharacterized lipoprotein NlpE involved in copper resistance